MIVLRWELRRHQRQTVDAITAALAGGGQVLVSSLALLAQTVRA
ncbi:hypothetical protein ABUW04_07140 [Streptacidiphilus sp. N1-10]|uniref:Uncharacterized protein n=1 Tax=Streptacidiphilus jeojiensis TaxID=3229225 RepID=A0ABV6XIF6_9ACTN